MISVILPVYNGEKYVSSAIESVLKQSETDFELIIVDDGSTDATWDVIQTYTYDGRIRVHHQENAGPGRARNQAMSLAHGDYFAFIDADDAYMPDKLKMQKSVLDQNPNVSVVWGNYYLANSSMEIIRIVSPDYTTNRRENLLAYMLFRNVITTPHFMFRRECYENGFRYKEDIRHNEDYFLILRLLEQYDFYYIDTPLYVYRRHENNLTNNTDMVARRAKEILTRYSPQKIDSIMEQTDFSQEDKLRLKGKIHMRRQDYHSALACFSKIDPNNRTWSDYFYLGNMCYLLNENQEALDYYLSAQTLNQKAPELYNNLGCVYARLKQENAGEMFQAALDLFPEYLNGNTNMGKWKDGVGIQQPEEYTLTMFELRNRN